MKTEEGTVNQNKGSDEMIRLGRKNASAQEVVDRPSLTSKGLQFFENPRAATGQGVL